MLEDLIIANHYFIHLLEKNIREGTLIRIQKRKRQRKQRKELKKKDKDESLFLIFCEGVLFRLKKLRACQVLKMIEMSVLWKF